VVFCNSTTDDCICCYLVTSYSPSLPASDLWPFHLLTQDDEDKRCGTIVDILAIPPFGVKSVLLLIPIHIASSNNDI